MKSKHLLRASYEYSSMMTMVRASLYWVLTMCQALFLGLYTYYLIKSSNIPTCGVSTLSSIFKMHREVK